MKQEEKLQIAICRYTKYQYPKIVFNSDQSGLSTSIGQAVKMKKARSNHAQLDVVILKSKYPYHALILEVKKSKEEIFKKDGGYRKSEHLQDQINTKSILEEDSYAVHFVWSLDMAKEIIDNYMEL